jgi:energy-coupling factor transporter ATP-binding protein EcfA2
LRASEQSVFEAIRYLDCTPEISGPPPREVVVSVEPCRSYYQIVEDGAVIKEVLGVRAVIDFLHAHLFRCSIAERPHAALLHAASLQRRGRRLLLAGTNGVGKTTLALALTRMGYEIEGDEHVFVERSGVVARPRACRVKESSLPMLADMAKVIAAAPSYTEEFYGMIFNLDPRALGSSWRIAHGQSDVVIALHDNHGGYSSIRPLAPTALVQLLIPEIALRETGHGSSVAAVAALAGRAKAFDLSLGDHSGALRCVERAMDASV